MSLGGCRVRVIAGTARGHKLLAVPGNKTRPTADRVKEAVFNKIGPFFDGGVGLDLFAGTGGLGIEALSRGLDKVVFIDRDRAAWATIRKNLAATNLSEKAEVYCTDALKALRLFKRRHCQFDLIFLDPPYNKNALRPVLEQVARCSVLRPNGVIVVEHTEDETIPNQVADLDRNFTRRYGNVHISLFQHCDKAAL